MAEEKRGRYTVHVLGGAAEELLGRALHDLGWPGREAHEKTLGLQSPRIGGDVERDYGLEKQRALTYFDPKNQRDLTRGRQR